MLEYEAENEVVRGGIDISKEDSEMGSTPQGNSSFAGIDFEIINRSANPVVVGSTDIRRRRHCYDHHHGRVGPCQYRQ